MRKIIELGDFCCQQKDFMCKHEGQVFKDSGKNLRDQVQVPIEMILWNQCIIVYQGIR